MLCRSQGVLDVACQGGAVGGSDEIRAGTPAPDLNPDRDRAGRLAPRCASLRKDLDPPDRPISLALGADPPLILEGIVDDPAFLRAHRRQKLGLAVVSNVPCGLLSHLLQLALLLGERTVGGLAPVHHGSARPDRPRSSRSSRSRPPRPPRSAPRSPPSRPRPPRPRAPLPATTPISVPPSVAAISVPIAASGVSIPISSASPAVATPAPHLQAAPGARRSPVHERPGRKGSPPRPCSRAPLLKARSRRPPLRSPPHEFPLQIPSLAIDQPRFFLSLSGPACLVGPACGRPQATHLRSGLWPSLRAPLSRRLHGCPCSVTLFPRARVVG